MTNYLKCSMFLGIMILSFNFLNVNAESYYTNDNGVQMTESEYNKVSQFLTNIQVKMLSKEKFDKYKNATQVSQDIVYYKVTSTNDEIIDEEVVTKEEYDSASNEINSCGPTTRSSDSHYIETSYKKFQSVLLDFGYGDDIFAVNSTVTWKKVPACRSYDVFALMLSHFDYMGSSGLQVYYKGDAASYISYNSSSAGYKSFSNGAGYSMNLKDDTDITSFDMIFNATIKINSHNYSQAHVFVTYQHAQNTLTRAQSMGYTLDISGLGNVVYYSNETIWDKYDEMPGIHLITPIS